MVTAAANTAAVWFMLNWKALLLASIRAGGSQWLWLATFISSFIRPVMYWPADTPEMGPVRM